MEYAVFGGGLFYFADGPVRRLYRSDGTAEGTAPLGSFYRPGGMSWPPDAKNFAVLGDRMYFAAASSNTGGPISLWRTDGTPQGTELVLQSTGATAGHLTPVGDQLYFAMGGQILRVNNADPSPVTVATFNGTVANIASAGGKLFYCRSFPSGIVLLRYERA